MEVGGGEDGSSEGGEGEEDQSGETTVHLTLGLTLANFLEREVLVERTFP